MKRPPDKVLDAALFYVALFDWVVFPVPPGTKKSYKSAKYSGGRRWGATNDPSIIERDFRRWPRANIGIPTGLENGFWVLEADTKKGHAVDGIASLRALERKYGRLPKTLMAISPSGSLHLLFQMAEARPDRLQLGIEGRARRRCPRRRRHGAGATVGEEGRRRLQVAELGNARCRCAEVVARSGRPQAAPGRVIQRNKSNAQWRVERRR